jgi:hypothetical protein
VRDSKEGGGTGIICVLSGTHICESFGKNPYKHENFRVMKERRAGLVAHCLEENGVGLRSPEIPPGQ